MKTKLIIVSRALTKIQSIITCNLQIRSALLLVPLKTLKLQVIPASSAQTANGETGINKPVERVLKHVELPAPQDVFSALVQRLPYAPNAIQISSSKQEPLFAQEDVQ